MAKQKTSWSCKWLRTRLRADEEGEGEYVEGQDEDVEGEDEDEEGVKACESLDLQTTKGT